MKNMRYWLVLSEGINNLAALEFCVNQNRKGCHYFVLNRFAYIFIKSI